MLNQLTQHATLNVYARCFQEGEPGRQRPRTPHRHPYYALLFVAQGQSPQRVDLQELEVNAGQVCLMVPHQIHVPTEHPFLRNPWHQPVFTLAADAQVRIQGLLEAVVASAAEARHTPAATGLL